VESGGGYGVFFSTKNERRKREKRDGPTLTKQAVRLHRQLAFFSLSLSLSFVLFLFPPAVTESNVKGDDEEFCARLILQLL
jgi:hypothetical protein